MKCYDKWIRQRFRMKERDCNVSIVWNWKYFDIYVNIKYECDDNMWWESYIKYVIMMW